MGQLLLQPLQLPQLLKLLLLLQPRVVLGRVHLLRLHSLVSLQRSWLAKVKPLRRVRLFSYWRL